MMFFMMMLLFFVVMRVSHGRRRHFAPRHCQHQHLRARPVRQEVAKPAPNAFERLKARYVQGELSDEQYEAGVDELLKTPEAKHI